MLHKNIFSLDFCSSFILYWDVIPPCYFFFKLLRLFTLHIDYLFKGTYPASTSQVLGEIVANAVWVLGFLPTMNSLCQLTYVIFIVLYFSLPSYIIFFLQTESHCVTHRGLYQSCFDKYDVEQKTSHSEWGIYLLVPPHQFLENSSSHCGQHHCCYIIYILRHIGITFTG